MTTVNQPIAMDGTVSLCSTPATNAMLSSLCPLRVQALQRKPFQVQLVTVATVLPAFTSTYQSAHISLMCMPIKSSNKENENNFELPVSYVSFDLHTEQIRDKAESDYMFCLYPLTTLRGASDGTKGGDGVACLRGVAARSGMEDAALRSVCCTVVGPSQAGAGTVACFSLAGAGVDGDPCVLEKAFANIGSISYRMIDSPTEKKGNKYCQGRELRKPASSQISIPTMMPGFQIIMFHFMEISMVLLT